MTEIVLITVTYNSAQALKTYWAAADVGSTPWVVVDNASTDNTVPLAHDLGAHHVIRLKRNVGFSAANNIAARLHPADCYIFVNPDVTVSREGVRHLAEHAVSQSSLVAPQLVNPDMTPQENGRTSPFLYRKLRHMIRPGLHSDYEVLAPASHVVEVDWAIGAAIAIPREIFAALSGWDEGFFVYYEDSDLCLRAKRLGYRTRIDGHVNWVHGWARATRKRPSFKIWSYEIRSAARFYARYPALLTHPTFCRLLRRSSAALVRPHLGRVGADEITLARSNKPKGS